MAAGLFTIKELLPSGLIGVIFHWTADERSQTEDVQRSVRGGARACPLGDWNQGGEMRSVATYYTGNPVPSEQVQGSTWAPQEFRGRWNDRYNFAGYAQETWREFQALCKRGNLVEISFQGKGYIGLLKNWNFAERRDWDIRYSFSLNIHRSSEESATSLGLTDRIQRSPVQFRDEADDLVAAMALADEVAPRSHMVAGTSDAVASTMATIEAAMATLDGSLDQRDLNVRSPKNPISPFSELATQFRTLTDGALDLQAELLEARSDTELAVVTAQSVLDFEEWSRSLRFHSRVLMGQSLDAEAAMVERDSPAVERLYRPYAGESLMHVSRQVYGTPHQWHSIADANALDTEVLTGEEILIIPRLGGA